MFPILFAALIATTAAHAEDARVGRLRAWTRAGYIVDVRQDDPAEGTDETQARILVSLKFALLPEKKQAEIATTTCALTVDTEEKVTTCSLWRGTVAIGTIDDEGTLSWDPWYLAEIRRRAFARAPTPK